MLPYPNHIEPHMQRQMRCYLNMLGTNYRSIEMIATPTDIERNAPNQYAIQCIQVHFELIA